jgi:hypothetical protein
MTQFFTTLSSYPGALFGRLQEETSGLWIPSNVWRVKSICDLIIIENAFHLNYRNTRDAPNNRVFIVFGQHVSCLSMSPGILTSTQMAILFKRCHLYRTANSEKCSLYRSEDGLSEIRHQIERERVRWSDECKTRGWGGNVLGAVHPWVAYWEWATLVVVEATIRLLEMVSKLCQCESWQLSAINLSSRE